MNTSLTIYHYHKMEYISHLLNPRFDKYYCHWNPDSGTALCISIKEYYNTTKNYYNKCRYNELRDEGFYINCYYQVEIPTYVKDDSKFVKNFLNDILKHEQLTGQSIRVKFIK